MGLRLEQRIVCGDCLDVLGSYERSGIHLSFLDPPFNQGKEYRRFDDRQEVSQYWSWMEEVLSKLYDATALGGAVYFMQREKNAEYVLRVLRESGWTFRNLIVWKKMTSAVPVRSRYGLQYQIIAYAVKGDRARVFNRLRITPPLPSHYRYEREGGIYVTDVWDDIRELTAGYFAGDEALRREGGERFHKQQSPLALLVRIILSSSFVGDVVCDPFAGTGTTCVASSQLGRIPVGIEIDEENVAMIRSRLGEVRGSDIVNRFYGDYRYTDDLDKIWHGEHKQGEGEMMQEKEKEKLLV